MLLDSRLNLNEHVQSKTNKSCKIIGLIKKIINTPTSITYNRPNNRPNLDYSDLIFDKPNNDHSKVESKTFSIKHA